MTRRRRHRFDAYSLSPELEREALDGDLEPGDPEIDPQPAPLAAGADDVFDLALREQRQIVYVLGQIVGKLVLEVRQRIWGPRGGWSGPKVASLTRGDVEDLPDAADRRILSLLRGAEAGGSMGPLRLPSVIELRGALLTAILPSICATGRAFTRDPANAELAPLAFDAGAPWELGYRITTGEGGARLEGLLARGGERIPVREPELLHEAGLLIHRGLAAHVDFRGCLESVKAMRGTGGAAESPDLESLMLAVAALPGTPWLELPAGCSLEAGGAPRPCLLASGAGAAGTRTLRCRVRFDYGGIVLDAMDPRGAVLDSPARRLVRRAPEPERAAIRTLVELGCEIEPPWKRREAPVTVGVDRFPKLVRELLARDWAVEADGKALRKARGMSLWISSGQDWFELHGGLDFGGEVLPLPALLAAARKGERTVKLGDGSTGILPEDWLRQLGLLLSVGSAGQDTLRFARGQAWVLDALLLAEPKTVVDAGFARLRERLHSFTGIAAREAPAGFHGELRSYQQQGLGWMALLRELGFGGCLADDMGLGKTVQVLALLAERRQARPGPSLVVLPKSLVFNWREEAARFAPELRVVEYTGSGRDAKLGELCEADLVLTTYGVVRRDAPALRAMAFDYLILDEAHTIKNAATQAAKACRLLQAEHRLTLTGTPVENRLEDLWSLLEFLNPGMLGSLPVFQELAGKDGLDERGRELLARAVRPFLLRRTKEQVARDLPDKTEQVLWCELEEAQRRAYDESRDYYRSALLAKVDAEGLAGSKIQVLEALLRLRQVACHPGLVDQKRAGEPSAKLDLLLERLAELASEGRKALVFSQFTKLLGLVGDRLRQAGLTFEYLDGRTRDREGRVARFQADPACPVFLVSLKVGGVGLNLTAAEYVFLLDPWWNPAVEAQAIDRTHRIGQDRPVFAYRLVARDTVEERILALQEHKRELAAAIVEAGGGVLKELTREDLELLLS